MDRKSGIVWQKPARLPGLELLRWIAALCVLLLHTPVIFGLPHVFAKGYLGVDLFFMLSGYVMARSFENRPPAAQTLRRFLFDRYARMWPMMALGGLIGLPLLHARLPDPAQLLPVALANLLLIPFAFRHEAYPLDVPAWTIIFILLGNLLHHLVLFRLRGPALALAIFVSAAVMAMAATRAGNFDVGARPEDMGLALPRLLLAYLIGIAICKAWGDTPPLAVPPILALAAVPVLVAGACWLGVTSWPFDMGFVVIACPLMIAGAMRWRNAAAWPGLAGAWSFPLYAIHFPLLIRLRNDGATAWQAALVALALSALATWLEIRLRAWRRKAGSWRSLIIGTARLVARPSTPKDNRAHGPILHR